MEGQFKEFANSDRCINRYYASMAVRLKEDGSPNYASNAAWSCGISMDDVDRNSIRECETQGGKCMIVRQSNRYSANQITNVESERMAEEKNKKYQDFIASLRNRCSEFGFASDTPQHSDCMLKLNQQMLQNLQHQQALKQQKEAIEQQRQDNAMKQILQGLQMMSPPSTYNQQTPVTQTITTPNGKTINCTTTGNNTNCY